MQSRISNAPGAFIGVEAYQSRRTLKEQQRVYTSAEWMMARGTAMRRDNYRCKRCGRGRQDGIPLEVHHRHTLRTGGDAYELDNLVTLCRRCHHEEHPDPACPVLMTPNRTPEELVEQLRNAPPTEPRIGAERIRPRTRKGRGPYWVREQWRQCDCPDCDKVAHWMFVAGGPNREDVERA